MFSLQDSHSESHFRSSLVLRDIVIGMSDGLTVPFALAAGLSGAAISNGIILTAGVAEIAAGAISMGLGGYLAGKTDREVYEGERQREYKEVEEIPEEEKKEVRLSLKKYGITAKVIDLVVEDLVKDKHHWVDFMMRNELGLEEPHHSRPAHSAINIGGSYAVGGFIPLVPYWLTSQPHLGLFYSSITTCVALGLFGFVKSKLTAQAPLSGALRTIMTGALAAFAAYIIARLVHFN